jgi:hypothetical protein
MIGGIEETSASFEARSAPRSYPTILTDIAGTSLDKGTELNALAKLDESEQRELAERAKNGEEVSAKEQEEDDAVD